MIFPWSAIVDFSHVPRKRRPHIFFLVAPKEQELNNSHQTIRRRAKKEIAWEFCFEKMPGTPTIENSLASGGCVQIQLLDGGSFGTADEALLHAGVEKNSIRLYDWCFYIYNPRTQQHILWDAGLSDDKSLYTPWVLQNQWPYANPVGPRRTLVDQLKDRGVQVGQVETVIFSHAHWDHCRPISTEFPSAKALFGPGTRSYCSPGHFVDGSPAAQIQWDGRFFDAEGYATQNWEEIQGPWVKWGPFDKAVDFFGDGSFWIIDAPGHMPGNLCAAAKLEGSDSWVILGSDCCHSRYVRPDNDCDEQEPWLTLKRKLLDGSQKIAVTETPSGPKAFLHTDMNAAYDTIGRLRRAELDLNMHVALGHDVDWMIEGKDEVLMSLLSNDMKGEWLSRVKSGEQP